MNIEQEDNTSSELDQRTITMPFPLFVKLHGAIEFLTQVEEEGLTGTEVGVELKTELTKFLLDRSADKEVV